MSEIGLTPPTSAPGLGPPIPCHIRAGTKCALPCPHPRRDSPQEAEWLGKWARRRPGRWDPQRWLADGRRVHEIAVALMHGRRVLAASVSASESIVSDLSKPAPYLKGTALAQRVCMPVHQSSW